MTDPKNTPQDERDSAIIAMQIERLKSLNKEAQEHSPLEINALAKHLKENNMPGVSVPAIFLCIQEARRGYVPNQTVVAIAEAAAKEEREKIYKDLAAGKVENAHAFLKEVADYARKEERERCAKVVRQLYSLEPGTDFFVQAILNPPEAK